MKTGKGIKLGRFRAPGIDHIRMGMEESVNPPLHIIANDAPPDGDPDFIQLNQKVGSLANSLDKAHG